MRLKLTILIIVVLIGVLSCSGVVSAAGYNDYTISNSYSFGVGSSGDYSNSYAVTPVFLSDVYPQLTNDTSLTYIKYRVRFNGTDARSDRNPYLKVTLGGDYNNTTVSGRPASPLVMSTNYKSNSTQGQWYTCSYSFNPNNGTQVANRLIHALADGYDSYDYCSFSVEILEIRYRKYTVDFTTSVTPDRYVQFQANRYSGSTETRISIRNINDGRWLVGSSTSGATFTGSNTVFTVVDNAVMPEKTYTYYLYYQVGSSNDIPLVGPITVTIKVPSDATVAVEQTVDAGYSAAQWAHWANDNAAAAEDMAREARDRAVTASTNAINAYNEAHSANTKLDDMQVSITNIQNNMGADTTPPEVIIRTVSGASATSGSQIGAVVNASDNVSTNFGYSLDGTVYQPLPADGVVNLPVNLSGNNLITVWVKDEAGNIGRDSITIRKL